MTWVQVQMTGGGGACVSAGGLELWCGWGTERKKSHIWMERGFINQDGDSRRGHMVPSASAHPVHANTVTIDGPDCPLDLYFDN